MHCYTLLALKTIGSTYGSKEAVALRNKIPPYVIISLSDQDIDKNKEGFFNVK